MFSRRSPHFTDNRHIQIGLFAVLPPLFWFLLLLIDVLVVMSVAALSPAFASDPHSSSAEWYQRSLAWGAIGHNAPLSHYPLALSLGYLVAIALGVLQGLLLLLVKSAVSREKLLNTWRTDHVYILAAASFFGVLILLNILLPLPFLSGHVLSLQSHNSGYLHDFIVWTLHSRFGLALFCACLYLFSVIISAVSVYAPLLQRRHQQASRQDEC